MLRYLLCPAFVTMQVLPCSLGARCHEGETRVTWNTVDTDTEQANTLLTDHVKYTYKICDDGGGQHSAESRREPGYEC